MCRCRAGARASLADEIVERRSHRQARDTEVGAQLPLGRDRVADAELLDQVEHPARASRSASSLFGLRRHRVVAAILPASDGWSRPVMLKRSAATAPRRSAGSAAPSPGSKKWKPRADRRASVAFSPGRIRVRGSTRAVNSVALLGEERRVVVRLAADSAVTRGASTRKNTCVSAPSSSTTSTCAVEAGELRRGELGVLEGLRPDAEHDAADVAARGGGRRRAGRDARRSASSSPSIDASTRFIAGEPMNAATKRSTGSRRASAAPPTWTILPSRITATRCAERHRLGLVVRDVDRRDAELRVELRQRGAHADAQLRVEVRERLVHQERLRLAHDRAAHRDPLALAAGELLRLALEHARSARAAPRPRRRAAAISAFGALRTLSP